MNTLEIVYNNNPSIEVSLATVGATGPSGPQGADGDSAYQVAVDNGFVGTEEQWLASLVGPQGEQGIQGERGLRGEQGIQGERGIQGATGEAGPQGLAASVAVGTVTTVAYEESASVTNSGTINSAVFDFEIPRGDTGLTGPAGPANTLSIGTVTSDGAASVTITGTSPNQTLNFVLPKGDQGDAATIAVGTVLTGAAGSQVVVTNSGTSGAAVLNFTIPRGDTGVTGPQGIQGNSIVSVERTSGTGAAGTTDTYTITFSDATTDTFTVYNGADGTGSGDMSKSTYDTNNDGKVNSADTADSVPWSGVTSKPSFATVATSGLYSDLSGAPTNVSHFTNDAGYLTGFIETDPVFVASPAHGISSTQIGNWDTAYGWGDHSAAGYQDSSEKGQANGYASLDSTGKVPASELPSYVDDVAEYDDLASFPTEGLTGTIYVAIDTHKIYRWSGTTYIEIAASPGSTDAVPEGTTNLYFTNTRARQAITVTQNLSYDNSTGLITGPDLSGYLTSYTETDPVFVASPAYDITTTNISNWNTAYGWGNHATAGYLTSETDPVFAASEAANITPTDTTNWDAAYGWGNHASAGYLTSFTESDPVFAASPAGTITSQQKTDWSTAYSWGNHASAGYLTQADAQNNYQPLDADLTAIAGLSATSGLLKKTAENTWSLDTNAYLTSESDPVFTSSPAGGIIAQNIIDWNTAYGWGNHASAGYLTSYTETDPVFVASVAHGIDATDVSNWNSAYSWGNHASAGYLTSSAAASTYQPLDADLTAIGGLAGTTGLLKKTAENTWTLDTTAYTTNTGTVTSVAMTVPTGLSVSGTPITSSGTLAVTLASGYSIPTTTSQTNWDTAYADRNKWDGGATGLVAATGRASLGVTATGSDTTYAYRANNLSDLASAATARTNLGLGTAATMAGPSGPIVGTTDTQTLTNKTLTGYTETVYSLTGTDINPANGTIQYKTLGANTTFTESLADGQCVTLMLNPATYTVTWPTTTWVGSVASTAPTLVASVYNCITFFQIAGTLYGKYEGRV